MKIGLSSGGQDVGHIDWDVEDMDDLTGHIRRVRVKPKSLGERIVNYLRNNPDDLRLWGGQPTERLDLHLDGVAAGLTALGLKYDMPIDRIEPRHIAAEGEEEPVG